MNKLLVETNIWTLELILFMLWQKFERRANTKYFEKSQKRRH